VTPLVGGGALAARGAAFVRARRVCIALATALLLALAVVPAAGAHAPLGAGDNESLATATHIPDPTKSWAIYSRLHEGGEAQYYRFVAEPGQRIPIQLFTSSSRDEDGFAPSMVILGPGVAGEGSPPASVEVPAGAGSTVVAGGPADGTTYEPFSPSAYRVVASTTLAVPERGTYYVAVFDQRRGGRYGLAIGSRESFTPTEWLTTPLAFASIYSWEGQPLWLVYAPAAVVVALGLVLLARRSRRGRPLDPPGWTAALAGLLFLATGATTAWQMVVALARSGPDALAVATVFLAALAVAVGVVTLGLALRRSGAWTAGSRALLALLGLAAIVVWAGWLAGPALALVAAVLPSWPRRSAELSERGGALR
jgi:hypothetical protein